MKLTFCGAAKIVTGSCYFLETDKHKILVDCGMFQGSKEINRLNYQPFLFNPKEIDFLFLTHAHIDHCGLIPKLVKQGFKGRIFATSATIDIAKIMLDDSAHIQEIETMEENERLVRLGEQERQPLYTRDDVKLCTPFFSTVKYDDLVKISDTITVRYNDAGHIIGSSIIEMFIKDGVKDGKGNPNETKIVFSGDLGQWDVPIVNDPTLISDADYVLVESTYGNRLHEDAAIRDDLLLKYIKEAYKKGGKLLIPSFALERTQEILYSINKLIQQGKFPDESVYLDSPLAIRATEIFKKHPECFDKETLYKYKDPFNFEQLKYTRTVSESKKINSLNQPCIVIAGNGMCSAGRIRYHLKFGLWKKQNTLLFVGYQAEGTLGRYILEGAQRVRMMGMEVAVKADIRKINSFSAHADYEDILKWMKAFKNNPKVFIVHGEPASTESLKVKLELVGFKCKIPSLGEKVII